MEIKNTYKALVTEPQGRKPHGRLRCNWEDTIKMELNTNYCVNMQRLNWLRIGPMVGIYEYNNTPFDFLKEGNS